MIITGRSSSGVSSQTPLGIPFEDSSERPLAEAPLGAPKGGLASDILVVGLGPHILERVVSPDSHPVGQVKRGTLLIRVPFVYMRLSIAPCVTAAYSSFSDNYLSFEPLPHNLSELSSSPRPGLPRGLHPSF